MDKIKIQRLTEQQKEEMDIPEKPQQQGPWAVWECGPSAFDWHYDGIEKAYVYEGKVRVTTADQKIDIQAGDFVTFPSGLDCRWDVFETVRKVYRFE